MCDGVCTRAELARSLADDGIGCEGVGLLADALKKNSALTSLG